MDTVTGYYEVDTGLTLRGGYCVEDINGGYCGSVL